MKKRTIIGIIFAVPAILLTIALMILSSDGVQKSIIVSALKSAKIDAECETFEVDYFSNYRMSAVKMKFEDGTILSAPTLHFDSNFWGLFFTGTLHLSEPTAIVAEHKHWRVPATLNSLLLDFNFGFFKKINVGFKIEELAGTPIRVENGVVNFEGDVAQVNLTLRDKNGAYCFFNTQKIMRDKSTGTFFAQGNLTLANLDFKTWLRGNDFVRPTLERAQANFRLVINETNNNAELKLARINARVKNEFSKTNKNARALSGLFDVGGILAGTLAEKTNSILAAKTLNGFAIFHDYFRQLTIDDGHVAFIFNGKNKLIVRDLFLTNDSLQLRGNGNIDARSRQIFFGGQVDAQGDLGNLLETFGQNPFPIDFQRAW